jgi:hypothetical protein
MATTRNPPESPRRRRPPAKTPEAREQQLITKSIDFVEKQIEDGTVSAQVLTHYLKLATKKHKLEEKNLEIEAQLKLAKIDAMESGKQIAELYGDALAAMSKYQGRDED